MQNDVVNVAIIGGGFSGTALAIQLLRLSPELSIAIVDKTSAPGRGLAYSSKYRYHLLNVPASNMSLFPEDSENFLQWARVNLDASIQSRSFVSRWEYGVYMGALFEKTATEARDKLKWIQGQALSIKQEAPGLVLQLADGHELSARMVVLATGNFPPADLKVTGLSKTSQRYVPFAWSPEALENLPRRGSVLLVGSGLTSLDLAMGLKSKGFGGRIHILSRRGLLPQRYQKTEPWPLYWNAKSPRTIRGLVQLVRSEVRRAAQAGIDWRAVIDSLRPVTTQVWQSLPITEQKRFLRHVRSHWEAHRHRVAPEIGDLIQDLIQDGQLRVHAGRMTGYRESADGARAYFRERKSGRRRTLFVDRVINCTGSETDCRRIDDSLLMSLFAQGLARPDPLFLGLDVDATGALLDSFGNPSPALYTIGPTRKGLLWETTAVPEIRVQAADLAEVMLRSSLNRRSDLRNVRLNGAELMVSNSNTESARF